MRKTTIICCLLCLAFMLSSCLHLGAKKSGTANVEEAKPALEVRHFLFKPSEKMDAEAVLRHFADGGEIFTVSKFPAHVATAVVNGDFLPKVEELGTLVSAFSGRAHLKNGMVLPMELVKWEKNVRRDGTAPKRDEKGTGISLRFEAQKDDDDITLVTSIWYSVINGCAWASETGGLLAADAGLPKVLYNLPTEMHMGQTTLFAVVSDKDEFYSFISVALVRGDSRALKEEIIKSGEDEKKQEKELKEEKKEKEDK